MFALQLLSNGFVVMGRCVPSVCDKEDVQAGWNNFFNDTKLGSIYIPYVLNCHTEDEESKIRINSIISCIINFYFSST